MRNAFFEKSSGNESGDHIGAARMEDCNVEGQQ